MPRRRPPRRKRRTPARGELQTLLDETIALFHWISYVAEQIYGDDARGASRRWVLRALHRRGPQTVPTLARGRAIRRQSLQPVVDGLVRDGLARLAPNPAHARSRLVEITRRGADLARRLDAVDARVLASVGRDVDDATLAAASATLRAVRRGFETGARWRFVVA
jgi:DNA-binding MarR family transcriptional regulator